ncbi:macrolide 2'-phosphotransferase [Arthrobacter sp.]|uniref:macrolide 2'-phosphotransferase n=1 Tax=Arthrobacter sp. TaxID=1667 RepID=UPI0028A19131|nr:macrolide 2'-phosphotransferase [Arthrobacter sp.]
MGTVEDLGADGICALAKRFGLVLEPESVRFNEAGLDYRVAFATATGTGTGTDEQWVLRVPRRPDVAANQDQERAILDFVRPRLPAAVPDWRIQTEDLIAYPLLPGTPGLTVGPENQTNWHFDPSSRPYLQSLAKLIGSLHSMDAAAAAAAGIPAETPETVRQNWADGLGTVEAEFRIAPDLLDGWRRWLDDDHFWPARTVLTHGELYPAHLLLDDEDRIVSVLDWTTAKVSDPALEFMYVQLISPGSLQEVATWYQEATGHSEPYLVERCAALIAAGPLNHALYALTTGLPEHRDAAAAQLKPA